MIVGSYRQCIFIGMLAWRGVKKILRGLCPSNKTKTWYFGHPEPNFLNPARTFIYLFPWYSLLLTGSLPCFVQRLHEENEKLFDRLTEKASLGGSPQVFSSLHDINKNILTAFYFCGYHIQSFTCHRYIYNFVFSTRYSA